MIQKLYLNSYIFLSLLAYIISIIFLSTQQSSFTLEAFAFLITAITLNFIVVPLEYYQAVYQVEESSIIEIELRRRASFQFVHLFFLVFGSITNNFYLLILSFVFFLFSSVLYVRTHVNFFINLFNFIVLVFWILFIAYDARL